MPSSRIRQRRGPMRRLCTAVSEDGAATDRIVETFYALPQEIQRRGLTRRRGWFFIAPSNRFVPCSSTARKFVLASTPGRERPRHTALSDVNIIKSAFIGVNPRRRSSGLAADVDHGARRRHEIVLPNVVASFLALHDSENKITQLAVISAAAHHAGQVMVPDGKQAGADFAVGGKPHPAAMPAKGMRDRGNNADFPHTIVEAVAARGLAGMARNFDQRPERRHALQYFFQANHDFRGPDAVLFQGHELDEAHDHVLFASEPAEGGDLVVVEAAQEHAVDFHRPEAGAAGGSYSRQDLLKSVGH